MTINIENAKRLPRYSGVYIMKDLDNQVIYVGKASSLRGRVSQYFRDTGSPKIRMLIQNVESLEYIVTATEVEALVLESNLIKEHVPRYNVRLRDDKAYPFIKITNEEYPRICIARRRERDGAQYFGPYPGSGSVRQLIKMASSLGIRRCRKNLPCRPCLNYHIKQCAAPCIDAVTKEEYLGIIRNVSELLRGRNRQLIQSLTNKMELLSKDQEYEKAARIRDQIDAVKEISEKQRVDMPALKEQDVLAFAIAGEIATMQVFHISGGRLRGRNTCTLSTGGSDEEEMLSSFIKQYYLDIIPPQEIIVPVEIVDGSISLWLANKGSRLKTPRNAVEKGLMNLAQENSRMLLSQELLQEGKNEALLALQKVLSLSAAPSVIEAFDISNISGTDATGSLVAFLNGKPDKKNYRRFKIKTIEGADDLAMMGEVVKRAYARRIKEGKRMPDLVLIDGGKGQLGAVLTVMSELGLDINTAALAKQFEHIFLPEREAPVILPKDSPALKLLQMIRDEAHRFAAGYHRKVRAKRITESELDRISGIGEKKKRALLKHFGSLDKLKASDFDEIIKVPGISRKDAEEVWKYFRK